MIKLDSEHWHDGDANSAVKHDVRPLLKSRVMTARRFSFQLLVLASFAAGSLLAGSQSLSSPAGSPVQGPNQ
jgi:hypothetical protein